MKSIAVFIILIPIVFQLFFVVQKVRNKANLSIILTTFMSLVMAIICMFIAADIYNSIEGPNELRCGPPSIVGLSVLSLLTMPVIALFGYLLKE